MTFNLIDLALGCILVLSLFFSRGLNCIKEIVRLVGILFTTVVALHYYIPLGKFLKEKHIIYEPLNFLMAFAILTAMMILLFAVISEGWLVILKIELPAGLNKAGSYLFSILRTYFVFALIYVGLLIVGGDLARDARLSLSQRFIGKASLWVYQGFFDNVVKKALPNEEIQQNVVDLILNQKTKKEKPTPHFDIETYDSSFFNAEITNSEVIKP